MRSKSELALAGELLELLELIVVQAVHDQIQADDQADEHARADDHKISAGALRKRDEVLRLEHVSEKPRKTDPNIMIGPIRF